MGYRFERDKLGLAGLTTARSELVSPPRVAECPVQLVARIERVHEFGAPEQLLAAFEASILRERFGESLVMPGTDTHIDPEQWCARSS